MSSLAFGDAFEHAARRVRRALAARRALDGATLGAIAGALAGGLLLALGRRWGIPVGLGSCAGGALAAAAAAMRQRWSDADVALFLDARLTRDESISTALEQSEADGEIARHVTRSAVLALGSRGAAGLKPKILRRVHSVLPVALLVLPLAKVVLPARPHASAAPAHAGDQIRVSLDALKRVEALRGLDPRSVEERARLAALAEAAQALEKSAQAGMDRHEAIAALTKLRDGVDAARATSSRNHGGRDAAARVLAGRAETQAAARALASGDLVALDQEMERLARSAEARSREVARAALDDAARAARERGDDDVAEALDEQRHLLEGRAAKSEALRELARLLDGVLPPDTQRRLARLDRQTAETQEALADALANALEGLTAEERKQIGSALRRRAQGMQRLAAPSREDLEHLAKALSTPEAREQLRQELKALAEGRASDASRRARALGLAQIAIAEAIRSIDGDGSEGASSRPQGSGATEPAEGSPGNAPGGGRGVHAGETPVLAVSSMPARAAAVSARGGIPIGVAAGLSPAVPGETAHEQRQRLLQIAAPSEIGAVEHASVPKAYREQVGRYFAP